VAVRKNQATLTRAERKRFVEALLKLKRSGGYDRDYVRVHQEMAMSAHMGPGFLPWHREFLRRLEADLQAAADDRDLGLPYWDWTVDQSPSSSIWSSDFMGGNGRGSDGRVMGGPFAFSRGKWALRYNDEVDERGRPVRFLTRRLGVNQRPLPAASRVQQVLAITPYDSAPWDGATNGFRWPFERLHNQVHVWVGGSMLQMTSPNDPVFFLHHANVDRLWAQWQRTHRPAGYLPRSGGMRGQNLDDPMRPWRRKIRNVLDHRELGYEYDDE
jgi:tyrosinase